MGNGDGLKKQWGVGDPAKPSSDKQAREFQATFQREIGCINGHLQYTSANAEAARHNPLEARRDALYPAFQGALAQIDPTNPAKAKGSVDKVLADVKALSSEVSKFRAEAEKAHKDWQGRQPKFDAAVHQVEELEAWGDAKAAPLRGLVDGIRGHVNERRFAQACTILDQLLPKLKPIYDEYLKQKAAKPKYEQAVAEQSARLDALKGAERPSQPMTAKAGEADTAVQQARAKADTKDFVAGLELIKGVKTANDALDKLAKDPQRAKFLADSKAVEELVNTPADVTFKTLEADWTAILQLREQASTTADAGDYAGANKMLADLKAKADAYKKKVEELKKARDSYKAAADKLEAQMQEVNACAFPALDAKKGELSSEYQKIAGLVTAEDFKGAEASAKALDTAIKAFLAERDKQRDEIKTSIKSHLPAIEADMKALSGAKSAMKDKIDGLIASIKAAASGNDDAALGKAAKDLDQLPGLVAGLKQVEEIKGKLDGAKTEEDKKKAAQAIVDEVDKKGGMANLPTEARNILIEEMMKGKISAKDTAAINKIWANPSLDPDFDALDKPVRDKIIKTYAEDPKVLEYRKNWATMTPDQKKEAIKYLTKVPCGKDGWNVGDPKEFEFFDSPKGANGKILYGSYNNDSGKMKMNLNNDAHGDFDELLDTVAHEIGHKQQGVLIDQYRKGTLKPGDPNYEEAKSLSLCDTYRRTQNTEFKKVYSTSPEEAHSREMGSELQAEMKKKFPKTGTPAPGTSTGSGTAPTTPTTSSPKESHKHDEDDDD